MTSSAVFAAPAPSERGGGLRSIDVLLVCMAALPMGIAIDQWFGLLPALTARCGGIGSPLETLEWHWTSMPATSLMMLFAAPAWIGLKAFTTTGRSGHPRHDRPTGALAALFCHVSMLIGMALGLGAGPSLAALVGSPWTSGAAIGAMAAGMVCGMAAASLCGMVSSAARTAVRTTPS